MIVRMGEKMSAILISICTYRCDGAICGVKFGVGWRAQRIEKDGSTKTFTKAKLKKIDDRFS